MIELLELIVAVFLAPFFLLAVILACAADFIRSIFNIPLLAGALGMCGFAAITWSHMTPDPSVRWMTLVDVIGQAHVFGVPLPYLIAGLAGTLLTASLGIRIYGPRDTV